MKRLTELGDTNEDLNYLTSGKGNDGYMGQPWGRKLGAIKDRIRKHTKKNVIKRGSENLGLLSDDFYEEIMSENAHYKRKVKRLEKEKQDLESDKEKLMLRIAELQYNDPKIVKSVRVQNLGKNLLKDFVKSNEMENAKDDTIERDDTKSTDSSKEKNNMSIDQNNNDDTMEPDEDNVQEQFPQLDLTHDGKRNDSLDSMESYSLLEDSQTVNKSFEREPLEDTDSVNDYPDKLESHCPLEDMDSFDKTTEKDLSNSLTIWEDAEGQNPNSQQLQSKSDENEGIHSFIIEVDKSESQDNLREDRIAGSSDENKKLEISVEVSSDEEELEMNSEIFDIRNQKLHNRNIAKDIIISMIDQMIVSSPKQSRVEEQISPEITLDSDDSMFDSHFSSKQKGEKSSILPLGQDGTEIDKTSTGDEDKDKKPSKKKRKHVSKKLEDEGITPKKNTKHTNKDDKLYKPASSDKYWINPGRKINLPIRKTSCKDYLKKDKGKKQLNENVAVSSTSKDFAFIKSLKYKIPLNSDRKEKTNDAPSGSTSSTSNELSSSSNTPVKIKFSVASTSTVGKNDEPSKINEENIVDKNETQPPKRTAFETWLASHDQMEVPKKKSKVPGVKAQKRNVRVVSNKVCNDCCKNVKVCSCSFKPKSNS